MKSVNEYKVLGIMSGTSLDGLDIVAAIIRKNKKGWSFELVSGRTIKYSPEMEGQLKNSMRTSAEKLLELDVILGKYIGGKVNDFLNQIDFQPDFISSHGHTVFHQPEKGFTLQIGNASFINKETGLPVINDFRSLDVALGGQGAPLVPIGDKLLFGEFDACINLGGFSNISTEVEGKRIAYDMGPANIILNHFARKLGEPFDSDGINGRNGVINKELLNELNGLEYYRRSHPKSLGYEWVEKVLLPVFGNYVSNPQDMLTTLYAHISDLIGSELKKNCIKGKVLMTGGGALNSYLVECIKLKCEAAVEIVIPEKAIIDYKEAIVFALLGVLRWENLPNCLSSVTGASNDCSGGVITGGKE